ncbi:Gfo/Idh/MocA family protein [Nibricoccus sp. IMCC34717]|uniref:Gfo/Idh/MocA family protein n=1 Tax=Nibricoccus sp. IMCC34717 TaxID=3034021 RepID=UPI0038508BA3
MSYPLSRRRFFAASAAAVVPLVLPRLLRGAEAPSNHVRLAAIGVGGRGHYNCLNSFVRPLADARVVAACDCFEHKRENFAAEVNAFHGSRVCEPVADFRDVLARPDIDGVIISTPDHWHVPIAYAAIAAGKAVYVEKPLTIAFRWAQKLRALARAKNAVFQYGTQQRGDQSQFRRACELVRNGYLGDVKRAIAWCPAMDGQHRENAAPPLGSSVPVAPPAGLDYDMWLGPAPLRPYTVDRCLNIGAYHIYDYALGFIAGWGAHPLDIMQWGLDLDETGPDHVAGTGTLPVGVGLWDTLATWDVTYRYGSRLEVRFTSERQVDPALAGLHPRFNDHGTTFIGEKGWISVNRDGLYASDRKLQAHEVRETEIRLPRVGSHARNFVDAIRRSAQPISPLESAIRSDTLSHLGDICIRTGRPLRWDPRAEEIIGDSQASALLDRHARAKWDLLS